jgi:hypothetical protein
MSASVKVILALSLRCGLGSFGGKEGVPISIAGKEGVPISIAGQFSKAEEELKTIKESIMAGATHTTAYSQCEQFSRIYPQMDADFKPYEDQLVRGAHKFRYSAIKDSHLRVQIIRGSVWIKDGGADGYESRSLSYASLLWAAAMSFQGLPDAEFILMSGDTGCGNNGSAIPVIAGLRDFECNKRRKDVMAARNDSTGWLPKEDVSGTIKNGSFVEYQGAKLAITEVGSEGDWIKLFDTRVLPRRVPDPQSDPIMVPDSTMFNWGEARSWGVSGGQRQVSMAAADANPWAARKSSVFWRGSSTAQIRRDWSKKFAGMQNKGIDILVTKFESLKQIEKANPSPNRPKSPWVRMMIEIEKL